MPTIPDQAAPVEPVPALDPAVLLISAAEAAKRLSISKATLHKLVAVGAVPKPIHLGSRALWRVEELEEWVRDGCPLVERWERRRSHPLKPPARPARTRPSPAGA